MTRPGSAHIIRGNALALPLADASVDLVVTSPPYFGLRSYQDGCPDCADDDKAHMRNYMERYCPGCNEIVNRNKCPRCDLTTLRTEATKAAIRKSEPKPDCPTCGGTGRGHYAGQIGSEPTPAEFIDALIAATREMVRVLKPSGSIFVNLGDKYAGGGGGNYGGGKSVKGREGAHTTNIHNRPAWLEAAGMRAKSLMLLPERYRIACVDQLGLIARAVIVWNKPNGLPESVTDRVRRSHEDWVHLTKQPRYYSAVDEIREPITDTSEHAATRRHRTDARMDLAHSARTSTANPLGKLPGSVWSIPTQPLTVPPELGVDHFAAFPMEWPRRIIQGWSPAGVCTVCGEGRRPVLSGGRMPDRPGRVQGRTVDALFGGHGPDGRAGSRYIKTGRFAGYACACTPFHWEPDIDPDAPPIKVWDWHLWDAPSTTPGVVADVFGGTGTTALVAKALGRIGISVDMSADYCRLAEWRCNDPGQMAAALQVEKPKPRPVEQGTLELEL